MKKILAILLITSMMLSLGGCMGILQMASQMANLSTKPTEEAQNPTPAPAPTAAPTMAVPVLPTEPEEAFQTGYETAQECMYAALAVDYKYTILSREQHRKMYSEAHWEMMLQSAGVADYDTFYNNYVESALNYVEAFQDKDVSYTIISQQWLSLDGLCARLGFSSVSQEDRDFMARLVGTSDMDFLEVSYCFFASNPDDGSKIYEEYDVFYFYERDSRWYVFKL